MNTINKFEGGVTSAKGFLAAGAATGLKKIKKDMALIVSEVPCICAGAFTTNTVKAAPVIWDQKIVNKGSTVQAIAINSGNANACTGEQGYLDVEMMANTTSSTLKEKGYPIEKEGVLVCSTGVIGVPLNMDKINNSIKEVSKVLGESKENGELAAEAILTTDTFKKQVALSIEIDGNLITIGGMAKGSGMIHPNMATMLSFITTDANIDKDALQGLLKTSIHDSYNMISVDGDTSTNDTVLVLANGMAGGELLNENSPHWKAFKEAFIEVHTHLAKSIVKDGEGAGVFIETSVEGAKDKKTAQILARSIISSNLVKTAFFGSDANWGRILCAMGYSGAEFSVNSVTVAFSSTVGSILVVEKGLPLVFDEAKAKQILLEREVKVLVYLQDGKASALAWGCDLSYEYVRINGDYRS